MSNKVRTEELRTERPLGRSPLVASLLAFATVAGLYLATAPRNRSETDDAFAFAKQVEELPIQTLFGAEHVSHLLFLPFWRGTYVVSRSLGLEADAYDFGRFVGTLLTAAAVLALFWILRSRLGLSLLVSGLAAAGFASSYAVWRYANEADAYGAAFLSLAVLTWLALSDRDEPMWGLIVAVAGALASLIHVMGLTAALAFPPILFIVGRRYRMLLWYGGGLVVILLIGLWVGYTIGGSSTGTFAAYVDQGAGSGVSIRGLGLSLVGATPDLLSAQFLFGFAAFGDWLQHLQPTLNFREEAFLAARFDRLFTLVGPVTAAVVAAFGIVLVVLSLRRGRPRVDRRAWASGAWVLLYVLVASDRSPGTPEAWIPVLFPIWCLVALVVFARLERRTVVSIGGLFIGALMVHNLAIGMLPLRDPDGDLNRLRAEWLVDHAGPGDVILTAGGGIFERYLDYRSAADVVPLEYQSEAQLEAIFDRAVLNDGRTFVTDDVLAPMPELKADNPESFTAISRFGDSIRPLLRPVATNDVGTIFVIES